MCPDVISASTLPDEELRSVAAGAAGLLLLESARAYGFVTGGPAVDVDRCEDVLALAAERGLSPTDDDAQQAALRLVVELSRG